MYTSMYREVVSALEPLARRALPDVRVKTFQAGSEKVRARLEAELAAGATRCDLLLVSDPAIYESLAHRDLLAQRVPPAALRQPRALLDLAGRYALSRVSTMVIGVNPNALGDAPAPRGFEDLTRTELRGRITMGDPLSSGTAMSTVAALANRFGWSFLERLVANGASASGGNAAVLARLESREAAAGILLYENLVLARRKGTPVQAVWPSEGPVLVAGHVAILSRSAHRDAVEKVEDFLLGPAAQRVIVDSGMHGADPNAAPPEGAPSLADLIGHALVPPPPTGDPSKADAALRTRWSRIVAR